MNEGTVKSVKICQTNQQWTQLGAPAKMKLTGMSTTSFICEIFSHECLNLKK